MARHTLSGRSRSCTTDTMIVGQIWCNWSMNPVCAFAPSEDQMIVSKLTSNRCKYARFDCSANKLLSDRVPHYHNHIVDKSKPSWDIRIFRVLQNRSYTSMTSMFCMCIARLVGIRWQACLSKNSFLHAFLFMMSYKHGRRSETIFADI